MQKHLFYHLLAFTRTIASPLIKYLEMENINYQLATNVFKHWLRNEHTHKKLPWREQILTLFPSICSSNQCSVEIVILSIIGIVEFDFDVRFLT